MLQNQPALDMGSIFKRAGTIAGNKEVLNAVKGMAEGTSSEQKNSRLESLLEELVKEVSLLRKEIQVIRQIL
ncbi:hypothetical protein [Neobacillus terrae]|uniref:hypothetical protein n=1 Tax=Neobacillus terrae TaxID=3034837 RepID=UPI00140A4FD1|nr:hypothetical protein [Neobacillus terrae]NHM32654.1 hypothetical protein [Neobacillus terrae]